MTDIQMETEIRMTRFFPRALETALASYRKISRKPETEYPDLKKQQEACKIAIAHIQLLLKMGDGLTKDTKENDKQNQEDMLNILKNAQEEINGHSIID